MILPPIIPAGSSQYSILRRKRIRREIEEEMPLEIYLDHAATSHPKPECVLKAVERALTIDNANPGRSGHARAIRAAETVYGAREAAASLINAEDVFQIAFTFNCTDALNLAIKGTLKKGDHAICSQLEHNSVLRVLCELERAGVISLTIVKPAPDGIIDPVSYVMAIKPNTALMVLSHASNVTGAVQPVEAVGRIARLNGIPYLIDGAQALGMTNVDVQALACDFYAFPGHKGLLGPQGTGGLYIKRGRRLKTLREGGTGSSSESMLQPEELPERYEAGTLNLPGLAGLKAGSEYVKTHLKSIADHEAAISQHLYEELSKLQGISIYSPSSPIHRTGVVSFNISDLSSGQAAEKLNSMGFCVRGGLHCAPGAHAFLNTIKRGAVRASVGYTTTHEEIDAFIKAVYTLSKSE